MGCSGLLIIGPKRPRGRPWRSRPRVRHSEAWRGMADRKAGGEAIRRPEGRQGRKPGRVPEAGPRAARSEARGECRRRPEGAAGRKPVASAVGGPRGGQGRKPWASAGGRPEGPQGRKGGRRGLTSGQVRSAGGPARSARPGAKPIFTPAQPGNDRCAAPTRTTKPSASSEARQRAVCSVSKATAATSAAANGTLLARKAAIIRPRTCRSVPCQACTRRRG